MEETWGGSDLGAITAAKFLQLESAISAKKYAELAEAPYGEPVLVDQPSGVQEMPWVTMWRPLKQGATFEDGIVKLRGLPF